MRQDMSALVHDLPLDLFRALQIIYAGEMDQGWFLYIQTDGRELTAGEEGRLQKCCKALLALGSQCTESVVGNMVWLPLGTVRVRLEDSENYLKANYLCVGQTGTFTKNVF